MKTFFDLYNSISRDNSLYNYYDKNLELKDAFANKEQANSFIINYFQNGEKDICKFKKNNPRLKGMFEADARNIHTVSVFTLGIAIALKMEHRISGDELFIWFLMCLFHDIGYKLENNTDEDENLRTLETLDNFLRHFNIQNDNNIFGKYREKETLCRNYYICGNYYKYRKKIHHKIDHGIAGGILLYKMLVENYNSIIKSSEYNTDTCEYKGLKFSEENSDDYKKAAIGIIRHNMWYANKSDDCKTYHEYGLDDLISEPQNKICYTDDRLLFLLCLADTIEPLKRFRNLGTNEEINEILRQICMDIENINNQKNSKITITIQVSDELENKDKLIENCRSLDSWMNVKTTQEDNKVKITFSFQNKSIDDLKLKISERAVR